MLDWRTRGDWLKFGALRAAARRLMLLSCAVCEPYGNPASVLRSNSRVMVDGLRPSARALNPCCFVLAIVILSSG